MFWKLLAAMRRARFGFRKRALAGTETYVASRTAGQILLGLVWLTLPPLLLALASAALLLISEIYMPVGTWRWSPVPMWHLADRDSYATFLSTISGIGGVLIGLYYAGLTAVSSAVYSQAPEALRSLLLRQPVGKLYMRLLAYVTFVALCLLAFYGIGFSPVRPAIPFLLVLSGVTILSFIQLGQQAFYFFDPTKLAASLFADLERCINSATVRSQFWRDPSFQDHANTRAGNALKTLNTLADYAAARRDLKSDAIAELSVSTMGFLYRYEGARQLIPSDSKWYPQEYRHPDFYAAGDLKMEMAMRGGGSVTPEASARAKWVQEAALPVVLKALKANLEENDDTSSFRVLGGLQVQIERLAQLSEVEQAITTTEEVAEILEPFVFSDGSDLPRWRLGLIEQLCLLPTVTLLGFVKALEAYKLERIESLLSKVRWKKAETIYRAGFPRFALPTLEWYSPRLEFEAIAERRIVSPEWLIKQGLVKDYLIELHKSADLLLKLTDRLYGRWCQKAAASKNQWAAALILSRQGEYLVKLRMHFGKIMVQEQEYESAKVIKDMVGWQESQTEHFKKSLVAAEHRHEISIAKEAKGLGAIDRPAYLPDFAGEFLSRTAQSILSAIIRNDVEAFGVLFPFFFQASVAKTGTLLRTADGEPARGAVAVAPLLDLAELSGYAIIASELRQAADPWKAAESQWSRYLLDEKSGSLRIRVLLAALQTADMPMTIAPSELLRIGWRMQIQQLFRDVPVEKTIRGGVGFYFEDRVGHPSALIRVLARASFGGMYRGFDVFCAQYFVKLPGNEKASRELRSSGLLDAVQREARREDEQNG